MSFAATKSVVPAASKKVYLRTDSSLVHIRYFSKDSLSNYRKQPEFKYETTKTTQSWWARFWHWFWRWFVHLFDFLKVSKTTGPSMRIFLTVLKYVFIALGLGALTFLVFKLIGIDINMFRRAPRSANIAYSELLENIHDIDFDDEIEKAASQQNYRLAVRMLYLKCLKQLNDASLIKWQPEKTNSAYIGELSNTSRQTDFKLLTRQFEYVWYGEFAIDGNAYRSIHVMFQSFNKNVA